MPLVVPCTTLPKFTVVGPNVVGEMPVPESVAVSGLFEALLATVKVPAGAAPSAIGVKVAVIAQLALGASTTPQVVVDMT